MPTRPADGRNPTKTRLDAKESKKNVALNKKAQEAAWKVKLKKDGGKVDRLLADLQARAKKIADMMKKKEDTKKAVEDFADILLGALKEMKTFTEVPVREKLPDPPKNTVALASMLPVLIAAIAWWKAVRKAR
jgi:hypothetical protein